MAKNLRTKVQRVKRKKATTPKPVALQPQFLTEILALLSAVPRVPVDLQPHVLNSALERLRDSIHQGIRPNGKEELSYLLEKSRTHLIEEFIEMKSPKQGTINITLDYLRSNIALDGYCTLDDVHINDIAELVDKISEYADDPSRKRPLNALMLASPGSGKSHFVECLAKKLKSKKIDALSYNMTALEKVENLLKPIDEARNMKVKGKLPLILLDEFDAKPSNYGLLLPLLWDGEIQLGDRGLSIGRAIFILAGSRPDLADINSQAKSMRPLPKGETLDSESPKLVDLLSRINAGIVEIPGLDVQENGRDRRVDKVCIFLGLLKNRFGLQLHSVPQSILRFVALAEFRYGVRSIAHLVNMIPYRENLRALKSGDFKLPIDSEDSLSKSSLSYHIVNKNQALGTFNLWKDSQRFTADVEFVALP